ncbi:MAG TPA: transporter [Gemmatimonadaceae bacterium]|nr:transporter [Gemmatimonadaceae bacterium]
MTQRAARRWLLILPLAGSASVAPIALPAQTDYYNTDDGRPLQTEDAYVLERYAFELQLAPLRLERSRGGIHDWLIEPAIAYGILPRTHIEIGLPIAFVDAGESGTSAGLSGLDISVMHNLNVETRTLPAFGLAAHVLAPVGGLAADATYASVKGIVTRTVSRVRLHLNGQYTFGDEPGSRGEGNSGELSRWFAGLAVDHALALRSMLIGGEVYAARPIFDDADVEWTAAAGIRYQLDPYFALDAGIGKQLNGDARPWSVTLGLARAFAVRALMPR